MYNIYLIKIVFHLYIYIYIIYRILSKFYNATFTGGSRAAAASKIERFVKTVNGWKPLTIITKRSILDVAAVLDPPLTVTASP